LFINKRNDIEYHQKPHAEVLIEKRKKGATFFHGICWNFLTIRRKLNELKIINDGNPLIIYTLFSPLYADVRQLRVV